jgi:hypothetical protein
MLDMIQHSNRATSVSPHAGEEKRVAVIDGITRAILPFAPNPHSNR